MADENLKIEIQVTGKSINDLKAAQAEIDKLRKSVAIGSQTFKEASKASAEYKNSISLAHKEAASANDKLMKSYFNTGNELRKFYREQRVGNRTMSEAGHAISGLTNLMGESGLGKAANTAFQSFQQAEFAVTGLGIAAQTAGGRIATMGAIIARVAAPLAAVAGVIGGGIFFRNQQASSIDELKKRIKEQSKELGQITKSEEYVELVENLNAAMNLGTEPGTGSWAAAALMGQAGGAYLGQERARMAMERKVAIQDAQIALKLFKEKNALIMDEVTATGKLTAQRNKAREATYGPDARFGLNALARTGGRSQGVVAAGSGVEGLPGFEFKKAKQEATSFFNVVDDGMSSAASSIGSQLGGAFTTVFGNAHTLLGQFVSSFLSQMAGLAASGIIRGLFSAITGGGFGAGFLGAFGIGSSAGGGGEIMAGGGNIGGMTSRKGGMGGMMQPRLVAELKYDRVAFKIQQGDRTLAARSL